MDSNGHITEFRCIVLYHLYSSLLIKRLPCHLRLWPIRDHSQLTIFSIVDPCLSIFVSCKVIFILLQLDKHLCTSVVFKLVLGDYFWVLYEGKRWLLALILLVMDIICQALSTPCFYPRLLLPLLD